MTSWWVFLCVAMGTVLRLLWLGDMEWGSDQREILDLMGRIGWFPSSAFAPVAFHSGVAHSSFSHYFMKWISLGTRDPLCIVFAIAAFNSIALGVAGWLACRDVVVRSGVAACALSPVFIQHSRKLWNPDLMVAWVVLGLGCMAAARGGRRWGWVAAPVCFFLSGHMYLPGLCVALIVSGSLFFYFLWNRSRRNLRAWTVGVALGFATFVPYLIGVLGGASETWAPSQVVREEMTWGQATPYLRTALTLPAPGLIAGRYLRPNLHTVADQWGLGWAWVAGLPAALSVLLWCVLFWAIGVKATFQKFRGTFSQLGIVALVGTTGALLVVRLGYYVQYWMPAMPLVFAWIAEQVFDEERVPFKKRFLHGLWNAALISSFLCALGFALVVHRGQGFPGEYGPAYSQSR